MSDFQVGDYVFLTRASELWMRRVRPQAPVLFLTGRLARVAKVLDWGSEEGRMVWESRKENQKWANIDNPEDYRYVLDIYFPELPSGEKKGEFGLVLPDSVPSHYKAQDGTDPMPLFLKVEETFKKRLLEGFYN